MLRKRKSRRTVRNPKSLESHESLRVEQTRIVFSNMQNPCREGFPRRQKTYHVLSTLEPLASESTASTRAAHMLISKARLPLTQSVLFVNLFGGILDQDELL